MGRTPGFFRRGMVTRDMALDKLTFINSNCKHKVTKCTQRRVVTNFLITAVKREDHVARRVNIQYSRFIEFRKNFTADLHKLLKTAPDVSEENIIKDIHQLARENCFQLDHDPKDMDKDELLKLLKKVVKHTVNVVGECFLRDPVLDEEKKPFYTERFRTFCLFLCAHDKGIKYAVSDAGMKALPVFILETAVFILEANDKVENAPYADHLRKIIQSRREEQPPAKDGRRRRLLQELFRAQTSEHSGVSYVE